jgi:hypothetical protein
MTKHVRFAAAGFALALAIAPALAAEGTPPGGATKAPSPNSEAPRVRDDLSEKLRPHDRHVYQRDMADCSTMERVDRQVCQRGVRAKARSKISRRSPH